METGRSKPLFRVLPVEREPMWDGNESRNGTRPGIAPLSENQCGMETRQKLLERFCVYRVEREPMWDGNSINLAKVFASDLVEREPMWDGNTVNGLLVPLFWSG